MTKDTDSPERALTAGFRQIAESIDFVFWLYNLNPFYLVYCSPSAERIWGFNPMIDAKDPGERHSMRMAAHIHPEDREAFADLIADLPPSTIREREYRIVNLAGETRWLRSRVFPIRDATGQAYRVAGISEDITDRKRAEQALELHRTFDRLINETSRKLATVSREQADEGFQRALREVSETLGADCGAISLLDDSGAKLRLTWRWASSEFGPTPFPETPFAPDDLQRRMLEQLGVAFVGNIAWLPDVLAETRERLLASGFRSMVDAGLFSRAGLIGVLGFGSSRETHGWSPDLDLLVERVAELFTAVIERLRREDETRLHRDQLAHVLRLGTMGQLASGIAHELNQPLSAIVSYARGCVRRLADGALDPVELSDALEKISGQALRAGGVIRTLREVVKATTQLTHEDIAEVMHATFALIEAEYRAMDIRLSFDCESDLRRVQIDRTQIEQVLLNLLKNAHDALAVASSDKPREVTVRVRQVDADTIELSVADTGPGVDATHREAIFDDFHTTKPDGLGLGLSISRSIIESHGGRLWLDADGHAGACFHFTLPVTRPDRLGGRTRDGCP